MRHPIPRHDRRRPGTTTCLLAMVLLLVWLAFPSAARSAKADGVYSSALLHPVPGLDPGAILFYQSSYGSPEVDKATATIKNATVSADRHSVRLVIDGLHEGEVHELDLARIRSAKGLALLHDTAYYTLNYLPEN